MIVERPDKYPTGYPIVNCQEHRLGFFPTVGLRLHDVLLSVDTDNPHILNLRQVISDRLKRYPQEDERMATLNVLSQEILGFGLDEMEQISRQVLIPYCDITGARRSNFIISSASSASASQEAECGILKDYGHIVDIPGAIEGRETISSASGDTVLISTQAGLKMARTRGDIDIIDIAHEPVLISSTYTLTGSDMYYKADSILLLAITNPRSPIVARICQEIQKNPIIHLYNLDEETQMALLWLSGLSNRSHLDINANSPEVAVELTKKSFRYPDVFAATCLKYNHNPYEMQKAEWRLSQSAKEIAHHSNCIPGYSLPRSQDANKTYQQFILACLLLSSRYGLDSGWLKPDRGTDGGNQSPVDIGVRPAIQTKINGYLDQGDLDEAISLYESNIGDLRSLKQAATDMWSKEGSWVIEAKTTYFSIKFPYGHDNERSFTTTPSVHVIKGIPRNTISLQLVDDKAWGGNLICTQKTWQRLVEHIDTSDSRIVANPDIVDQLRGAYHQMATTIKDYIDAVNASTKYHNRQVRGGIDLAVCTLGGNFGHDNIVVGVQDNNARANGCETAYALYDEACRIYGSSGQAITRNINPLVDFDRFSSLLPKAIGKVNREYGKNIAESQVKLIWLGTNRYNGYRCIRNYRRYSFTGSTIT